MIFLLNLVAGKISFSSGAKFHGDWCKNGHATRKKSENALLRSIPGGGRGGGLGRFKNLGNGW